MEYKQGMERFEVFLDGNEYQDGINHLRDGDYLTIFAVKDKPQKDDFPLMILWEGEIKQDTFTQKRYKMSTVPTGLEFHTYLKLINEGHLAVLSRV
jgi:hypothetical protein